MSAPSYGVNQKMPEMLKDLGVTVAVVAGTLDFVHRPHIKRWRPVGVLNPTQMLHGFRIVLTDPTEDIYPNGGGVGVASRGRQK